jgi:succinate dehydrogenase / fumarate reductase flavoprotein subunit
LVSVLEGGVRRREAEGRVTRAEGTEFLSVALDDDGACAGVVAADVASGELAGFEADAVIAATGGAAMLYGKSTNPVFSNGSAAAALYAQGAALANAEFIQFHPTAMPGRDKNRLISEAARGEGGRIFTVKEGKRWYFLEEMFPEWGNLITRDKASQAIYYVCNELGLGLGGKYDVALDISHLPHKDVEEKLKSVCELYERYAGESPEKKPMSVSPSAHYFMGGLYVNDRHMTTVPGLFAAGECDHQYHGANRLGGNSTLSAVYSGTRAGGFAAGYAGETRRTDRKFVTAELERQRELDGRIRGMRGGTNPYALRAKLGNMMRENLFIVRYNEVLEYTDKIIDTYEARWNDIDALDYAVGSNQTVFDIRQLKNMLLYARAIAKSALARDESRGAHYKPDFPARDDGRFLKTTVTRLSGGKPKVSFAPVDLSVMGAGGV